MSDETDLYETDAAYVEAWERWAESMHRNSYMMMDAIGIDTSKLPRPTGWGTVLTALGREIDQ